MLFIHYRRRTGAGIEGVTTHHVLPPKGRAKPAYITTFLTYRLFSVGFQSFTPPISKFFPYICPRKVMLPYSAEANRATRPFVFALDYAITLEFLTLNFYYL